MAQFEIRRRDGTRLTVLVDDADLRRVLDAGPWHANRSRGAWSVARSNPPKGETRALQRFVLGLPAGRGPEVDLVNADPLDCRRANLRILTHAEQLQDQREHGGTSKYRGVCWVSKRKKWMAYVMHRSVFHHLGYYDDENDAARAASEGRARFFQYTNEARPGGFEASP